MKIFWKYKVIFLIFTIFYLLFSKKSSSAFDCQNRFVTFINPVRDRSLWIDKSLEPIVAQKEILSKNGFMATWLVTYDVLKDKQLYSEIKSYEQDEVGVFLEITKNLAEISSVVFDINSPWYSPNVVFLSAYKRSERIKLIDRLFSDFYDVFGYFPKSVGAWWVDSFSLNYMKRKYDIKSVLVVADQKTTDSYGVWGQWWGFPYIASKFNLLEPSKEQSDDIVVLQWAQRHPYKAYYGSGPSVSNHSLQANDYISLGFDINFFKELSDYYLDCRNSIGQITVGMETGMEGFKFIDEYDKQIEYLATTFIKDVTMSQFADIYKTEYHKNNYEIIFGDNNKEWYLTKDFRKNEFLNDQIEYNEYIFKDYFLRDTNSFLDRDLSGISKLETNSKNYFYYHLVILLILFLLGLRARIGFKRSLLILISAGLSHFLIYRSYCFRNWCIFYGFKIKDLILWQSLLSILWWYIFYRLSKKINLFFYILSYGFLGILSILRYTIIDGVKYFGILIGWDRLLAVGFGQGSLHLINQKFGLMADALTKFNFDLIYLNKYIYLVVGPVFFIILGGFINKFYKAKKWQMLILFMLGLATMVYVKSLLMLEPSLVN